MCVGVRVRVCMCVYCFVVFAGAQYEDNFSCIYIYIRISPTILAYAYICVNT